MMRCLLPFAAALVMVTGSLASADQSSGIVAHHGSVYETKKAGQETQGFVEIINSQAVADTLTGVDCAIAGSTHLVGSSGNAIGNLAVPAGRNLILAADGPHILLQSTHFSIDQGGAIPCSLTFQNVGEVSVFLYPIPAP